MNFVGCLEADLQGAVEYQAGGVGPLFRQARREEPFALLELLQRVIEALRGAGVTNVVSLFIDEEEIYADHDAVEANALDAVLNAARVAVGEENAVNFYLMLTHEDDDLSHVITIEGSADHPAEEAALSVLDTAEPLNDEEFDDDDEADDEETAPVIELDPDADSHEPLRPVADDSIDLNVDEALDGEALVEALLLRLQAQLHKELALDQPEIETWTDWGGGSDAGPSYSTALPGVPGI